MRRQVKSKYLFMFKFYFVEKGMYIMKNKFNQVNKEIILNYVVKIQVWENNVYKLIVSYCFIDDGLEIWTVAQVILGKIR